MLILLVMILAGTVQGTCGFGSGLVGMSFLPFILDYKTALPIMYIGVAVISLKLVFKTYKLVNWKIMLWPVIFSLLGRITGQTIFSTFESIILNTILGFLILISAIYQMFFGKKIKIRPSHKNGAIAGLISGIMGGLSSAGGPPIVVYYINAGLEKQEYIATIQMTFLAGSLFSIGLIAFSGGYVQESLVYSAVAAIGILVGGTIGQKIFGKVRKETLMVIINIMLFAMGLSLVITSIF